MGMTSHNKKILGAVIAATISCGAEAQLAQNLTIHPKGAGERSYGRSARNYGDSLQSGGSDQAGRTPA